ncbi:M1 family metallopeptidase [Patulibacter sp. SYSU D01012]|uniref:M1 family metallopeptidase n=1 Tax=Patulibacter sp. SYSU D01012 TaxID=2817381 RepID=UPI001B3153D4|nr:M1 family metallopeptidase [Patulibacter sp. SYSU D01012]
MQSNHPRRSRRALVTGAGAAAVLAAVPAGAAAAPKAKPARLTITSLSAPPASLQPGDAFTITGKVRNSGGRASRALVALQLRAGAHPRVTYAVGGTTIAKVGAGRTRSFRVKARLNRTLSDAQRRSFVLEACAATSRTAGRLACRKAGRRAVVTPAPRPGAPAAPAPAAPPAAPLPLGNDALPPDTFRPGARTLGDALFPTIGNGGYDAQHYDLDLKYEVGAKYLRGTSTMTATATQDLSEFSLDLTEWNEVARVTVDGRDASFAQDADQDKLVVTPPTGIRKDATFRVAVTYSGIQRPFVDPDGSEEGWVPDPERGAIVVSEPVGSMGWFPNNNVPFDKATYTTRIAVPSAFTVLGTGVLRAHEPAGDTTTWTWDDEDPTSSYLYSLAIGPFDLNTADVTKPVMTAPAAGGLNAPVPFYTAIDSGFSAASKTTIQGKLDRTPSILDYYADYYGVRYPFTAAGGIFPLQAVGYSLETQGKPTYATTTNPDSAGAGISTVAHENGHMWFGDAVTLTQWKDIWLNEGMTEFSTWLWTQNANAGTTLAARFAANYTNSTSTRYWNVAPAAPPTAADIFNSNAMYSRGATTMLQVHDILGEDVFRAMMHRWLTEHLYGNVTTERFIALVKETDPARADRWTEFFRQWLYTSYTGDPRQPGNKPSMSKDNFDTFALPTP